MIKESNFPNAYKEVYTILKYVDSEALKAIPKDFFNMLRTNMNKNYEFNYNENIEFSEQKLLRETEAILGYMFLHFWANEKQTYAIKEMFKQDLIKQKGNKK